MASFGNFNTKEVLWIRNEGHLAFTLLEHKVLSILSHLHLSSYSLLCTPVTCWCGDCPVFLHPVLDSTPSSETAMEYPAFLSFYWSFAAKVLSHSSHPLCSFPKFLHFLNPLQKMSNPNMPLKLLPEEYKGPPLSLVFHSPQLLWSVPSNPSTFSFYKEIFFPLLWPHLLCLLLFILSLGISTKTLSWAEHSLMTTSNLNFGTTFSNDYKLLFLL